MPIALVELAEAVNEPGVEDVVDSGTFLGCETVSLVIALGVCQVELGVGNVEITAEDHRFRFFEFPAMLEKGDVPDVGSVIEARQVALGVWRIDVDDEKMFELRSDDAAFGVVAGYLDAIGYRQWLGLAKDKRAGVALLFSGMPAVVILRQVEVDIFLAGLRFLDAKDVRIFIPHKIAKAFF